MKEKEKTNNDNPDKKIIEYLELSAGMGKTYTTLKWIVEDQIPKKIKWIYVVPSKALASEIVNTLESFKCDTYHLITDEYYSKQGVMKATLDILCVDDESDIFIITHANWNNILDTGNEFIFEDFNVIIDELPEVFEMDSIRISNQTDVLKNRLKDEGDGVYSLPRSKGFIQSLREDGLYSGSRPQQIFYQSLLSSGIVTREVHSEKTTYETFRIRNYSCVLDVVDRLIILGAKITDTLTSGFLERQNIELKPFTSVIPSRTEYLNQERVTIYYLTDEKLANGCSSSLLNSYYNPTTEKKLTLEYKGQEVPNGYVSIYQEFVERAYTVLGDEFIYTVNYKDPYKKLYRDVCVNGEDIGISVPYNCHGLNSLSCYDKALSLFCFKPSPLNKRTLSYVSELMNYDNLVDKYIDHKMKEASYQLCTRTALRDFSDVDRNITFVVPDIYVAKYIKDNHIPNCVIDNSIALYIPDMRKDNGGFNKSDFSIKYNLSSDEMACLNNRKKYLRRNNKDIVEEDLIKTLNKYRRKHGREEINPQQ